jgi:hypothetical protein
MTLPQKNIGGRIVAQSDKHMARFLLNQGRHPETHTVAEGIA